MVEIVRLLSEGNNQIAVLAFILLIIVWSIIRMQNRMISSLYDFKKAAYESALLPERRTKSKRTIVHGFNVGALRSAPEKVETVDNHDHKRRS